jgi:aryl-alcohol dehydrogenase-like predicted oxidoreductase
MRAHASPALVVGCVQLGLAYGAANRSGKPSREAALQLLRRAESAGVGGFDTARSYGDAEDRLGEAFEGRSVRIITKLSPLSDLKSGAARAEVRASVDRSLGESAAALRRSYLDTVLVHRAAHLTAFEGAVWERLLEHRRAGAIEALGVSVQSPSEADQALRLSGVVHLQLPFNVLDWRWREAGTIDRLRARRDVTVHARSVFLQGILIAADATCWPDIPGVDAALVLKGLAKIAQDFGRESAADLCLAYARGQDWIDAIVVGQETAAQLESNLRLMARAPLDATDCAALDRRRPQVPLRLLDPSRWPRR